MPQAAPLPDTNLHTVDHQHPPPEPIKEDLGLRPELLTCWALRRAHQGGVTKSGDQYVDHGRLQLSHLTRAFDELTNAGLLALADADPSGLRRVSLTKTGHAHYTQLTTHQMTRSVPEPPSPHRTPAGRRSSCPDSLVTPGGQPDPDNTMVGIATAARARSHPWAVTNTHRTNPWGQEGPHLPAQTLAWLAERPPGTRKLVHRVWSILTERQRSDPQPDPWLEALLTHLLNHQPSRTGRCYACPRRHSWDPWHIWQHRWQHPHFPCIIWIRTDLRLHDPFHSTRPHARKPPPSPRPDRGGYNWDGEPDHDEISVSSQQ